MKKTRMKIVLVPDSFKGTMSSTDVCDIMQKAILEAVPDAEIISIPIADGGEGTVASFLYAIGGEKITIETIGPFGEKVNSSYGQLENSTAIIEMAEAAGLPLVNKKLNVMDTTTYGVGELILHALEAGNKKIIIGLGGSATNDGGAGACSALGIKFLDALGNAFIPVGGTLRDIKSIDLSGINPLVNEAEILLMSDIDNPMCGPNGAAHVFGPQKGANEDEINILDEGLKNFAEIVRRDSGISILELPGSGSAGGMGGGFVGLLGGELEMGIDLLLDAVNFKQIIKDADIVFSGEGKIDAQSLRGKVVIGVAKRTKSAKVPLIAVVGDIAGDMSSSYELGLSAITSINRLAEPYEKAKLHAKEDLYLTVIEIMRMLNLGQKLGEFHFILK